MILPIISGKFLLLERSRSSDFCPFSLSDRLVISFLAKSVFSAGFWHQIDICKHKTLKFTSKLLYEKVIKLVTILFNENNAQKKDRKLIHEKSLGFQVKTSNLDLKAFHASKGLFFSQIPPNLTI